MMPMTLYDMDDPCYDARHLLAHTYIYAHTLFDYGRLYVDPSTQSIHKCKSELKTSTQKQMALLPRLLLRGRL